MYFVSIRGRKNKHMFSFFFNQAKHNLIDLMESYGNPDPEVIQKIQSATSLKEIQSAIECYEYSDLIAWAWEADENEEIDVG